MKTFTIKEACEYLKISEATAKNWMKSGLFPVLQNNAALTQNELEHLQETLRSTGRLQNRRNKTANHSRHLYADYLSADPAIRKQYTKNLQLLLGQLSQYSSSDVAALLPYLLTEYALRMLLEKGECQNLKPPYVLDFIKHPKKAGRYAALLQDLLESFGGKKPVGAEATRLLSRLPEMPFLAYEDLLGWLYISLSNLGKRKLAGIYYTPAVLASQLVTSLYEGCGTGQFLDSGCGTGQFLDPACGTGQFLLACDRMKCDLTQLYGQDLDPTAVCLTRINLALNYPCPDITILKQNITCGDSLLSFPKCSKATIIGNPPWGSRPDAAKKGLLKQHYHLLDHAADTSSLFLEAALCNQEEGCTISFLLPQALLEVHVHENVRAMLITKSRLLALTYLGNCFHDVDCPSVLLTLQKDSVTPGITALQVTTATRSYTIHNRNIQNPDCLMLHAKDAEYQLIEKLTKLTDKDSAHGAFTTLAEQADFALGIVTGNNRRFISSEVEDNAAVRGEERELAAQEVVLRGENLVPYGIRGPYSYLRFEPEQFQQCADERFYRADEKLLYRFIGKDIIFSYDDQQRLTLNSCNILIPHIPGLSPRYLLAILNSRIVAFYLKTRFPSVKLLRRHLEALPIPIPDERTQAEIVRLVNLQLTYLQNHAIIGSGETIMPNAEIDETLNQIINRLYLVGEEFGGV